MTNNCIHVRSDGSCEILSAGNEVKEYCVEGPCPDFAPIEYIRRDEFIAQKIEQYCAGCDRRKNSKGKYVYAIGDAPCRACGIHDMLSDVEDFQAADVRENVRGKWILNEKKTTDILDWCHCSVCGNLDIIQNAKSYNFCPNCGADMRERT